MVSISIINHYTGLYIDFIGHPNLISLYSLKTDYGFGVEYVSWLVSCGGCHTHSKKDWSATGILIPYTSSRFITHTSHVYLQIGLTDSLMLEEKIAFRLQCSPARQTAFTWTGLQLWGLAVAAYLQSPLGISQVTPLIRGEGSERREKTFLKLDPSASVHPTSHLHPPLSPH